MFHLTNRGRFAGKNYQVSINFVIEDSLVTAVRSCSMESYFGSMLEASPDFVKMFERRSAVSYQMIISRKTTVLWLRAFNWWKFDYFCKTCTVLQVREFSSA